MTGYRPVGRGPQDLLGSTLRAVDFRDARDLVDQGSSSDSSLSNNTRSGSWTGVLFAVGRMHCRSVNRGMGDVFDVDSRGMFS